MILFSILVAGQDQGGNLVIFSIYFENTLLSADS